MSDEAARAAAESIGVNVVALRAVGGVESALKPFGKDGSPTRRFEPHKVSADLRARIGLPAKWTWRNSGKLSTAQREALYAACMAIDAEATHFATSYGVLQIMGFNAKACGYSSASAMFQAFADEREQWKAGAAFIKKRKAAPLLASRDTLGFAKIYNGSGEPEVYAAKLESWLRKLGGGASPVVLRLGARGPEVRKLQEALALLGYMPAVEIDDAFGPGTDAAVRRWQAASGLTVDGVVGARSWAELSAAKPPAVQQSAQPGLDLTAVGGKIAAGAGAVTATVKGLSEAHSATRELAAGLPVELIAACAGGAIVVGLVMIALPALRRWKLRERAA